MHARNHARMQAIPAPPRPHKENPVKHCEDPWLCLDIDCRLERDEAARDLADDRGER